MGEKVLKKCKVLFTIPNFNTAGSGKALLNIATRLDKDLFEPHIACLNDEGSFFLKVKASGIPIHIFQFLCPMRKKIKGLMSCYKVSRFFKQINPNIIYSFNYAPDYSEAISAKLSGIPWIFCKKNMNWGGKSKNGWLLRTFLAEHIILLNSEMKNRFYPKINKTTLIHRGVDLKEFSLKTNFCVGDIGIPKNNKVIMLVANLAPVKGLEYLIDAFNIINNKIKSISLIIVGEKDNNYGRILEDKAQKNKNIIFLGKKNNIAQILSLADIFILPTKKNKGGEGLPVSLIEAMAASKPVLASNVAGNKDVLELLPEQLFLAENVKEIVNKLSWMLSLKKNQINQIIIDQLLIIKKDFCISIEVEKHTELFKRICL